MSAQYAGRAIQKDVKKRKKKRMLQSARYVEEKCRRCNSFYGSEDVMKRFLFWLRHCLTKHDLGCWHFCPACPHFETCCKDVG